MTITHQTVVDSQGKPAAALIPWSEFLLIQEILEGGDVTVEPVPKRGFFGIALGLCSNEHTSNFNPAGLGAME